MGSRRGSAANDEATITESTICLESKLLGESKLDDMIGVWQHDFLRRSSLSRPSAIWCQKGVTVLVVSSRLFSEYEGFKCFLFLVSLKVSRFMRLFSSWGVWEMTCLCS